MTDPRPVLLLVDVSNHVWRASAAHPQLTSRRVFTGGLYGFVTTIAKTIRETDASNVIFGFDSRPYVRSREYPEYKQLRKDNQDPELKDRATETMGLVRGLLKASNFLTWEARGFEFDDLMGHAVMKYRHRFSRLWAASNDSDLFQFFSVCDRFAVYRGHGLADAARAREFSLMYPGIGRDEWILMQALQGTHNDIEGIPKVGPATAKKAISSPALLRTYTERHGPLIERNRRLIELPHREFPYELKLPRAEREYNPREFYRYLSGYEIDLTPSVERAFNRAGGLS